MPKNDNEESIISHLEALRSALIKCIVSIVIILPFAFYISPKAFHYLIKILVEDNQITLNYFAPMEVFVLQIKLALLISTTVAFPYIVKQLWDFILPALYEHEKKFIRNNVLLSSTLFVCGVVFCLFMILPLIIRFGASFAGNNIQAMFGVSNIINLSLGLCFVFGLMFQVPLITFALIKWDIVSYESISSKRPYVAVILLILAALLTPPDIVSQIMLFAPTYFLFEFGLLFSKKYKNSKKQEETL